MLIDLFIQKIDEILNSASLQFYYKGREQKLFKDVLQLFYVWYSILIDYCFYIYFVLSLKRNTELTVFTFKI